MTTQLDASHEQRLMLSADAYDKAILKPQLRKLMQGNFYNVGLWGDLEDSQVSASSRLVECLIDLDTDKDLTETVLDVGCGLGAGSALIGATYPHARVTGINYSKKQVELAASSYQRGNLDFQVADAVALPHSEASVDRIYCIEAALHLRTREHFLHEAFRVLRPGGHVFLADILCTTGNSVIPSDNVVPNLKDYIGICEQAGFTVVAHEDVTVQPVEPFCAYLRHSGHAPKARFFEEMVQNYVLVDLVKPHEMARG